MAIYIYNLLSIPIYNLFIKNKKRFTIVMGVQMFLILALRDITVGVDGKAYANGYYFIQKLSFGDLLSRLHLLKIADLVYPLNFESGYTVLNWLFGRIGFSYHQFMAFLSFVFILSFCTFMYRYSLKQWLSCLIFVGFGIYTYYFGINRQVLAMSIVLWSIPAILQKQLLRFLLIVLLAFTMHRSALVWIPLYFMANIKITRKTYRTIMLCQLIFFVFSEKIFFGVLARVLKVFGQAGRIEGSKLEMNTMIVLLLLILSIIYFFVDIKIFDDKVIRLSLIGMFCAVPIEIIGMYNEVVGRVLLFYNLFLCLLIPNVVGTYYVRKNGEIEYQKTAQTRAIVYIIITVLMLGDMVVHLKGSPMVPYKLY